jgi:hypothetical protein
MMEDALARYTEGAYFKLALPKVLRVIVPEYTPTSSLTYRQCTKSEGGKERCRRAIFTVVKTRKTRLEKTILKCWPTWNKLDPAFSGTYIVHKSR